MTLNETIKTERIKNGLSQAKLGEMLNVTQQAVGKWEKAQAEPDSTTLKHMAKLFSVSIDYLMGYEKYTAEEIASGAAETKKISITPIEEEMLNVFREIGIKHGKEAQNALITVAEKML